MNSQRMRGQSTVEFAVATSSLVLILLGTVVLSGFQETQRRTMGATRHAAFLHLWHNRRSGEALQERLQRLHFEDSQSIATSDLTASSGPHGLQGAGVATTALLQPLRVASGFLRQEFDLTAGGYQQTRLSTRLRSQAGLPAPFDSLDISVSHSMSLLGDGWNARDRHHVRQRTAGLVATSALSRFTSLWRAIATPLSLLEPNIDRLCPGLIEPEFVPEDRLGPVARPGSEGPCH